ncbi:L-threonylcarbamoyladenylate synthase [Candidatus Nitrospira bockiana]
MTRTRVVPAGKPGAMQEAAEIIRAGGLVAFPTETVYGLGADALNPTAVLKIFEAKRRPRFDPLIVHVADRAMLERVARPLSADEERLIRALWPGPLTVVVPKQDVVPDLVTAGLPTVAVRLPNHPIARALIREVGTPIAAPSANPFGYVSSTTAAHVLEGLAEHVDLIVDGGPCAVGVESTIVAVTDRGVEVLRPGGIPINVLEDVMGRAVQSSGPRAMPCLPGSAARHYATRTPLTVLATPGARPQLAPRERAGLLAWSVRKGDEQAFSAIERLSSSGDLREGARHLFAALRRLDALGLNRLYAEPCGEHGLGVAIMDRLRRCAVPQDAPTVSPSG